MSNDQPHESEQRADPGERLRAGGSGPAAENSAEFHAGGEPSQLPHDPPAGSASGRAGHVRPSSVVFEGAIKHKGEGSSRRQVVLGGSAAPKRSVPPDDQTQISKRPPLTPTPGGSLSAAEAHRELEGERLEHFELQELVGGGGMGAVFRALDTRLNRIVALKILAQDQAIDDEKIRRFRNEAQSAARLDHENVARVYYVGEDRGLHFIAFEFIPGTNIRDLVENRGPLPIDDALTYTYQIADALAHASSRDVVHRDIKPSNIIITEAGRAKLVDMGLARLDADNRSSQDLTASGVTLGTFDYISPEQALDPRDADSRSDIYSLGCTLYFMLTGQPPFPEGSPLQKLLHHHSEKPPDPRVISAAIPDGVAALVQRMMAKDPAARPQTPTSLVGELLELAQDLGLSLPATAGTFAAPTRRFQFSLEKQLPWLVPVVALLVVVGLVQALAVWPGSGAADTSEPPGRLAALEEENGHAASSRPSADAASTTAQGDPGGKAVPPAASREGPGTGSAERRPGEPAGTPGGPTRQPLAGSSPTSGADVPGETATGGTPRDSKNSRTGPTTSLPPSEATVGGTAPGTSGSEASAGKAPPTLPGVVESGGRESGLPVFDLARDREPLFPGFDDGDDALPPLFDPLGSTYDATSDTRDGVSEPEQPPAPATGGPGLRIVDPTQVGTYIYPTLRAACAAAQDGDVIELRYDGPRAERPFESRNRRLTIRAAENFSPLVRFCPTEDDPLKHPRHMMTVAAGRLTLVNLALELDLSLARPAEGWALFDIQQAELVRLEHCALSIRNTSESGGAQHADVSFFNVDAPPGASTMVMMEDTAPALPTALELRDSIARGEAVFLRVHDLQPVSLNWQNGFLATGQRLLVAAGGAKQPQHLGQLQLELRHLTMAARDGLCLLTNAADSPYQLITQIRCTDSIVVAGPEGSLIEQVGIDSVTDFRARLKWESERDFYDGFSIFWKIRGKSAATAVEEMTLTPWNAFWGGRERSWGRVVWREPPDLTRPPHLQTVADFELDQRVADNPARRGASDGRDAGCEAALLPLFPETRFESDLRSGERGGAAREQGTAARTPELR